MTTNTKETFTYQAEMKQLLHLIVHSLYTHPEIFLRELISNSSDALNKVRFQELTNSDILDSGAELKITIDADEGKKTFSIEDNGIGMTKEELVKNIGTVAKSGTLEYFKKLKEEGKESEADLIGQFGVGFYSVFMVTDQVIVETRSANKDSKGYRWISDGQGEYSIEEIEKQNRGTKISFILKDEYKDFATENGIKGIIEKYSNFASFPIHLKDNQINQIQPLWQKSSSEIEESEANEFYKFIADDFQNPLSYFHLSLEGTINFKALLFIPAKGPLHFGQWQNEKSVKLYSHKILIQDDAKDLLPEYLRFVKGVVDTEDLPLNVSREVTQNSPVMAKIKKSLTGRILSYLSKLAKDDAEKYKTFYQNFSALLKTGIDQDFDNKDKIVDLLRFESTKKEKGELISLKDYVANMKEDQKEIYFLCGDSREIVDKNPNLEIFKKHDIEVLLLTDPVDVFIIPSVFEYDKKQLKSIEKAELDFIEQPKVETSDPKTEEALVKIFKDTLGEKVEDVVSSKRLVDSPVTLVSGKTGLDSQTEKMMRMMNQQMPAAKKILEVNMQHPLIRNLVKLHLANDNPDMLKNSILQLYESALFLDGSLEDSSDFIKRMYSLMSKATE